MTYLADYQPQPHPLRDFFRSRGIRNATLARFTGYSSKYISSVMTGDERASAALEAKLQEAARQVEKEEAEANKGSSR